VVLLLVLLLLLLRPVLPCHPHLQLLRCALPWKGSQARWCCLGSVNAANACEHSSGRPGVAALCCCFKAMRSQCGPWRVQGCAEHALNVSVYWKRSMMPHLALNIGAVSSTRYKIAHRGRLVLGLIVDHMQRSKTFGTHIRLSQWNMASPRPQVPRVCST
jgi:hypothetical protein